ncbi:histidine phosphatase family protein [Candidatus Uhrbacteria bacterium]|nr:histidine phosphatase family protein [Candidatus Uhrbacteria bacterium]
MIIDWYLIRHAHFERQLQEKIITGRATTVQLTADGIEQVQLLAQRFDRDCMRFDEFDVSPAIRAWGTGFGVYSYLGLDPDMMNIEEDLQEHNKGDWEGRHQDEVLTEAIKREINENGWDFRPPNGETFRELERRALEYFRRKIQLAPRKDRYVFCAISHTNTIRCGLRGVMNFPPQFALNLEIDNTSITHLQYCTTTDAWRVVCINDTGHFIGTRFSRSLRYAVQAIWP